MYPALATAVQWHCRTVGSCREQARRSRRETGGDAHLAALGTPEKRWIEVNRWEVRMRRRGGSSIRPLRGEDSVSSRDRLCSGWERIPKLSLHAVCAWDQRDRLWFFGLFSPCGKTHRIVRVALGITTAETDIATMGSRRRVILAAIKAPSATFLYAK